MADQRGLLIARDARDWNFRAKHARVRHAEQTGRGTNIWQHSHRHVQQAAQFLSPPRRLKAEQHRARSVRYIRCVNAPAGQAPQQKRVNRAERQGALLSPRAGALDMIQNPGGLRA